MRAALAPLSRGNDALGARLGMIETAEHSIEIKTFLIKPGPVWTLLRRGLREAAERGVAVRLLFDDVFTTVAEAELAALDAHPNIEVRSFNPLSRRIPTALSFLFDFGRVNRRMHNKVFIVDEAYSVIGGRNIADEYYQANAAADFGDFDIILIGEAVERVSSAFDLFWDDRWSVSVAALATAETASAAVAGATPGVGASLREVALRERSANAAYLKDLKAGRTGLFEADVRVVVDPPYKLRRPPGDGPSQVADALYATLGAAEREVTVVTPYFIPQEGGAAFFEELLDRGVRVRIVTNSLSSTNHPYVHGAYARYRDRLLARGAEFREVRADAPARLDEGGASLTLHTKLAVVDEKTVFAGSSNLDPRSIKQNSEIGFVITSPAFAARIDASLDRALEDYTYRVEASGDGGLVWRYNGGQSEEVFESEPGASLFDRIFSTLSGWLPIENQL